MDEKNLQYDNEGFEDLDTGDGYYENGEQGNFDGYDDFPPSLSDFDETLEEDPTISVNPPQASTATTSRSTIFQSITPQKESAPEKGPSVWVFNKEVNDLLKPDAQGLSAEGKKELLSYKKAITPKLETIAAEIADVAGKNIAVSVNASRSFVSDKNGVKIEDGKLIPKTFTSNANGNTYIEPAKLNVNLAFKEQNEEGKEVNKKLTVSCKLSKNGSPYGKCEIMSFENGKGVAPTKYEKADLPRNIQNVVGKLENLIVEAEKQFANKPKTNAEIYFNAAKDLKEKLMTLSDSSKVNVTRSTENGQVINEIKPDVFISVNKEYKKDDKSYPASADIRTHSNTEAILHVQANKYGALTVTPKNVDSYTVDNEGAKKPVYKYDNDNKATIFEGEKINQLIQNYPLPETLTAEEAKNIRADITEALTVLSQEFVQERGGQSYISQLVQKFDDKLYNIEEENRPNCFAQYNQVYDKAVFTVCQQNPNTHQNQVTARVEMFKTNDNSIAACYVDGNRNSGFTRDYINQESEMKGLPNIIKETIREAKQWEEPQKNHPQEGLDK